jgi:hypothetical protein
MIGRIGRSKLPNVTLDVTRYAFLRACKLSLIVERAEPLIKGDRLYRKIFHFVFDLLKHEEGSWKSDVKQAGFTSGRI